MRDFTSRLERLLARRDELEREASRVQLNADIEIASLKESLDMVNGAIRAVSEAQSSLGTQAHGLDNGE